MNAIDKQTEHATVMTPVPLSPEALRALEERVMATIDQRRDTRDVNKLHGVLAHFWSKGRRPRGLDDGELALHHCPIHLVDVVDWA